MEKPAAFKRALQQVEARPPQAQARAQEKQADAAVTQADAALNQNRARASQADAQREQAAAQLTLAKLTLARTEQLVAQSGASTQADLDNARRAFDAARATLDAAQANAVAAQAAISSAEAALIAARAQAAASVANVATAEATRREAQRELAYTTVVAPADGRIGNKRVETGTRVTAGQALLALAEPNPWIVANFKETQLALTQPGQPVDLTIDALPGRELHGKIESLAPASGAQFALLPPDNATGNFNKVVQRVPVKILLDDNSRQQLGDRLRLGLSVIVRVRVR